MPDLMVDLIISLDGYAAAEGWPEPWGRGGPEYLAFLGEDAETRHTTLLGATTYRMMSAKHGGTPDDPMADLPKIVFSSVLTEPLDWTNTELVTGDAVEAVRELKETHERPLRTLGSLSLSRSLLRAGLVDTFHVVLFPVITGASGNERIFDGYPDVSLDLVTHRIFDGDLQLLEYVPTVLDAPPGVGR